jgi:hypothetical protein
MNKKGNRDAVNYYRINGALNFYLFYIAFFFDNAFRDILKFIIFLYFLAVVVGFNIMIISFSITIKVDKNSGLLFDRTKFTVSYLIKKNDLVGLTSIIF